MYLDYGNIFTTLVPYLLIKKKEKNKKLEVNVYEAFVGVLVRKQSP